MSRVQVLNIVGLIIGLSIFYFSFLLPGKLTVVLSVWLVLYIFSWVTGRLQELTEKQRWVFYAANVIYAIIALAIKFVIEYYWGSISYFWLNRLEHLIFSITAPFILFPVLRHAYAGVSKRVLGLFIIGVVSLVGNINEFLEFVYRYPVIDRSGGVFYLDTSFDIFTNALGAFMAWVIFVMIFPNYHREAVEESLPKS